MALESHTPFNVTVGRLVHFWLSITVEDESTTHYGLWMVLEICMGVFYEDDGMIGSG